MQNVENNYSCSNILNKLKSNLLPILAIIGIMLSLDLTFVYFNANFGGAPSFCDFSETINCDDVAKSSYALFLGVPNSLYGIGFYLVVLILSFGEFLKDKPVFRYFFKTFNNPKSYIFSLSTVAFIFSLILAWISATQIHKICVLCLITYLVNLSLLFASKSGQSFEAHYKNTLNDIKKGLSRPVFLVIIVIAFILMITSLYYVNKYDIFIPDSSKNPFAAQFASFNYKSVQSHGALLGAKNPRVIINEYTDFQCPYCAMSNAMIYRLLQEVDGVAVIHHDFPLDKACNPIMKSDGHKGSCMLVRYSRAAKLQGKYWEFNSLLFDNQQNVNEAKVLVLAKRLGLNIEQLKKDANNPDMKAQILKDVKDADRIGISSTPTYVIGMKIHAGLMSYPEFKQMVLSAGGIPKK